MPVRIGGKRVMIDANKVVSAVKEHMEALRLKMFVAPNEYLFEALQSEMHWLDNLSEAIKTGAYSSDPIPLPTIKPGDKVRHKDSPSWGMGVVTHTQHKASVMFDDLYVDLPIKGLEVVE